MIRKINYFTAACFVASFAVATPAFSQQTPPVTQQQIEISDGQMKEFIKLQKQVQDIQQNYAAKANNANNESVAVTVMQQAGEEMKKVIEKSSFSIVQFNQIATLLLKDEKLQQQYRNIMD